MSAFVIALDRSARTVDADGRLHVARSHISKATVNPYYGREIPGYDALGLVADKIYYLLRDPAELEKAAPTFARLPILSKHVPVTVDSVADDPQLKQLIIGAIGSNVIFDSPYLDADLCFWDKTAIAGIETEEVVQLSCAYRYVPVMEPGTYEGKAYDGRMTDIRGNHLAPVEVGRAGPDVVVADSNPFPLKKEPAMKMTKLGRALFVSLCAASPVLAADSALQAMLAPMTKKAFDKSGTKAKLIAMDATLSPEQLDNVIDALLDVEQDPKPMQTENAVGDEGPADKVRKMLAGKVDDSMIEEICALMAPPAADKEEVEPGMKPKEVEAAMDALGVKLRAEFAAAADATRDVRPVVGDVVGMDSAEAIYAFALDHLKVDHKGVTGLPALRALFKAVGSRPAPSPTVALDAKTVEETAKRFPQLSRFS